MSNKSVILVTGGAGYIGSQLIRDLVADARFAGMTIRVYDSLRYKHLDALMDLPGAGRYEFIEGDILDRLNLRRAMQDVVSVVHLAAVVTTPTSFDHPEWTKQVNRWGTAAVVECALTTGVQRLVYASSASVYGPGGPFVETDACHPVGPYAISKRGAEEEIRQGQDRGLNATVVRLATTFGNAPAMRFDATANRFAFLVGVGRSMVVYGTGEQIRPLIHIRDASEALRFCLATPEAAGEIFNAVNLHPSVNDIAKMMQIIWPEATVHYTDQDILTEISFDTDGSKLAALGFTPKYDLERGLREMLARWAGFGVAYR